MAGCFTNTMNYSLLSAEELVSFEPIFEWLAHLSGLDFCLCQTQDRGGSEVPCLATPRGAIQARKRTATVSALQESLGRFDQTWSKKVLPELPYASPPCLLLMLDSDPYENRSELSAVISAMMPEGTAGRGRRPLTINL